MRKRDGEVTTTGNARGKLAEALLGKSLPGGHRTYNEETGETDISISGEAYAELLRGTQPQPTRREGITVQFRGGFDGPAQILRFNRIREAREAANVTESELAEASFIPLPALLRYQDMEEGLDIPTAARDNIAGALGQSPNSLFPERRAGAGLPSLDPVPPPERTSKPFDQGRFADEKRAQENAIMAEAREARSAAEMDAVIDRLQGIQRDLEIHNLTQQAAALGERRKALELR